MIEIIATAAIAAPLGFLTCAFLTAGRVSDALDWEATAIAQSARAADSDAAHALCSDSRNVLMARIERLKDIASSQQSVKSGRIIAVLSGEGV